MTKRLSMISENKQNNKQNKPQNFIIKMLNRKWTSDHRTLVIIIGNIVIWVASKIIGKCLAK